MQEERARIERERQELERMKAEFNAQRSSPHAQSTEAAARDRAQEVASLCDMGFDRRSLFFLYSRSFPLL
jgi:hypothetical protein